MRRFASYGLMAALMGSLIMFAPAASAHWVKVDPDGAGCGSAPYVDANPADNDLLGSDPDAVVVIHACMPCSDDPNVEPLGIKVFGCGSHG